MSVVKWVADLSDEVVGWTMITLTFSSFAVYHSIVDRDMIGPVFFGIPAAAVYSLLLFGGREMCRYRIKVTKRYEDVIRG